MSDEPSSGEGEFLAGTTGLEPGSRVAGYLLQEQVGQGGMAVVYLALDERLGRRVALKILAPAMSADQAFRQRFIRESRAAAAVDDPHIIPVFDAGDAGGVLFIAMRYVPGGDVRSLVKRDGPLSAGRAAEIVSQVASALDAAHRRGLVHRDVKPANMLMDAGESGDRPDHIYLSDFGLSKGAPASVGLTSSGQFLGTPAYTAPEQIDGRAVDGRTDEYALACAAFEMLSGSPPFRADQAMAAIWAHMSEPPPALTSRRPDLPAAIDAVLARAMAKEPGDRYASCRQFADALRGALRLAPYDSGRSTVRPAAHPPTEVPGLAAAAGRAGLAPASPAHQRPLPGPETTAGRAGIGIRPAGATDPSRTADDGSPTYQLRRRRIAPATLASLSVLAAAGIVAAAILTRSPGTGTANSPGTSAGNSPGSTVASTPSTSPSTSPTGSRNTSPSSSRQAQTTGPSTFGLPLALNPGVHGSYAVAFSPDGKTLATGTRQGSTYLWDSGTGSPTGTLPDPGSSGVYAVAFSPAGDLAAGDGNGHAYVWNPATRKMIAKFTDPGSGSVYAVAFSPGGTMLATGDLNHRSYLWDVATGARIATLTDPASQGINALAFSPDGRILATGDYNGSTYLWNVATGRRMRTLTDPGPGKHTVVSVVFSPDGKTLAVGDYNGGTYLWDVASGSVTGTLTDPGVGVGTGVEAVAFSPDGRTLAAGDDNGSIYLWDVATGIQTGTLVLPGSGRRHVWAVAFSPDGSQLAAANKGGSTYLWNSG